MSSGLRLVSLLALLGAGVACNPPAPAIAEPPRATPLRAVAPATSSAPVTTPSSDALSFRIVEGQIDNRFFRDGRVAAHVLVTRGEAPRVVAAFPAGNMGVALWFTEPAEPTFDGDPVAVERLDGMRGVRVGLRAPSPRLTVHRSILGSIRVIRDAGRDGALRPGHESTIERAPDGALTLRRVTADGKRHVALVLHPLTGTRVGVGADGKVVLLAGADGTINVHLTALSDEPPLSPVPAKDIVRPGATADPQALQVLSFLTYDEKLLAGSWQYLTYFGRDTLLSTRLLMPVLTPRAVEAALGAVLDRLSENGEVAHEEDIGELAALRHLQARPEARPTDLRTPLFDRKMVDDDFLLAPVIAAYALDTADGKKRAPTFLARKTPSGVLYADVLARNCQRVVSLAEPFAKKRNAASLIHNEPGRKVGNWRDSEEGLGNGPIPYDVNAALVPAALDAVERLQASGLLAKAATGMSPRQLLRAWSSAEALFRVEVEMDEARRRIAAYAQEQQLDAKEALDSLGGAGTVSFPAVSLDARGAPVPIMHSDDGFVMLFTNPGSGWLASAASRVLRPFPAGLRTPVGLVVANPAYARDASLRAIFTRDHYHGTVVWSWQQAMLLSGLRRQLARVDLPPATKQRLAEAEQALAAVVQATKATRTSELWSFAADGPGAAGWRVVPFGQGKGHHTEANAAQLWSTVYLAVDAPATVGK